MRSRRKSAFGRARDTLPAFALAGVGIVGVFVAMNILVTAAPVVLSSTPTPAGSYLPVFAATPSAVLDASPTVTDSPLAIASLPVKRPTIVNSAVTAKGAGDAWEVYLSYPAFLPGTTPWAQQMNLDIYSEIQTRADKWEASGVTDPRVGGGPNKLEGSFTTELLTPALASFTLTWVDNSTPGGDALGVETINYDLSTGQRLGYDSVFADPQTAFVFMSGSALPQLSVELGDAYDPQLAVPGTSPEPEHYRHWALKPNGIKITFDQNQVVLSDKELPWVIVPWEAVVTVMNKTGPIAQLAGIS
jgi:hypothetical protein